MMVSTGFQVIHLGVSAYFLMIEPKTSGNVEQKVNQIAKVEFFLLFSCGIFMYSFPDQYCFGLLESDNSYRSIARGSAAMVISASFQSLYVSEFKYSSDKKTFMLSRLFSNLAELVVIFIGYYCLHALNMTGVYVFLACNFAYSLLVLYGYLITPENEKIENKIN